MSFCSAKFGCLWFVRVARLSLLALVGFVAMSESTRADTATGPNVVIERVEKIFMDGKWNGRPGIVFWKGQYYIFFRSGSGHGSGDGRIMVMRSRADVPKDWSLSPVIDTPENEAEIHMLTTPERIFGYLVIEEPDTGKVPGTLVIYTDDGETWSKPQPIYKPGWSVWKPRSYKGVHYIAADIMTGDRRVELLSSQDGLKWEKVSTIVEGRMTETDLVFLDHGTLIAVTRQGRLSRSSPPYKEWSSVKSPGMGGPAAALVGETILLSGRVSKKRYPDDQPGGARTGLFMIDPKTMETEWEMNLLTQWGGDVSYPHILPLDDRRALIAWYDGEPWEKDVAKQADLFLAVLRVE